MKRTINRKHREAANKLIAEMKAKNKLEPTTSVYITFESSYSRDLLCLLNVSNSLIDTKKKYYCCKNNEIFYIKHNEKEF